MNILTQNKILTTHGSLHYRIDTTSINPRTEYITGAVLLFHISNSSFFFLY
jgi:hypothetical protein